MPALLGRVRAFYGTNPLHLLTLLAAFALAAYAALRLVSDPTWPVILTWFVGAIIAHDLVLFPLYALADRSLGAALRAVRPRGAGSSARVSPLNYVRVPTLGAGLLLLMFFPGIIQQGAASHLAATGLTQEPFLGRWLLLTGAMFAASALAYAVRLATVRRPDGAAGTGEAPGRRDPMPESPSA